MRKKSTITQDISQYGGDTCDTNLRVQLELDLDFRQLLAMCAVCLNGMAGEPFTIPETIQKVAEGK